MIIYMHIGIVWAGLFMHLKIASQLGLYKPTLVVTPKFCPRELQTTHLCYCLSIRCTKGLCQLSSASTLTRVTVRDCIDRLPLHPWCACYENDVFSTEKMPHLCLSGNHASHICQHFSRNNNHSLVAIFSQKTMEGKSTIRVKAFVVVDYPLKTILIEK